MDSTEVLADFLGNWLDYTRASSDNPAGESATTPESIKNHSSFRE
jgi:hypothetical protein